MKKYKYIRTKDGRIFDTSEIDIPYLVIENRWLDFNSQGRFEILKQANTIKELCDGFLVEYKNGVHDLYHDFYHLQWHYNAHSEENNDITGRYGCIWVFGKGLIYVAKLNEEGELELL